jgi:hypothetical protein
LPVTLSGISRKNEGQNRTRLVSVDDALDGLVQDAGSPVRPCGSLDQPLVMQKYMSPKLHLSHGGRLLFGGRSGRRHPGTMTLSIGTQTLPDDILKTDLPEMKNKVLDN